MHKFLSCLVLFLMLPAMAAADESLPAREALRAFRAPMEQILGEAAKGQEADLGLIAKVFPEAKAAWMKVAAEPLDLARYGVPEAQREEVWRQVRTLGLLVGYLDESVQRSDRRLLLQATERLGPTYGKVAAALGAR